MEKESDNTRFAGNKFMEIIESDYTKGTYYIENRRQGTCLGMIYYHVPWRKHVWYAENPAVIFDFECTEYIASILKQLDEERKNTGT